MTNQKPPGNPPRPPAAKAGPQAAAPQTAPRVAPQAAPRVASPQAATQAAPRVAPQAVPASNPGPAQQGAPGNNPGEMLGAVTWLFTQSQAHRHLFITDLEWLVLPAIMAGQFRLFRRQNTPFAFASWAFLSEEAEARLLAGIRKLKPGDWRSGNRLWLIDLAAPFGGAEGIVQEIKKQVFPNQVIKTLRPSPDGKGWQAVEVMVKAAEETPKP